MLASASHCYPGWLVMHSIRKVKSDPIDGSSCAGQVSVQAGDLLACFCRGCFSTHRQTQSVRYPPALHRHSFDIFQKWIVHYHTLARLFLSGIAKWACVRSKELVACWYFLHVWWSFGIFSYAAVKWISDRLDVKFTHVCSVAASTARNTYT